MRNGRDARLLEEVPPKPLGGGARLAGDSGVLPVSRSKGPNGVLLVRYLQGLAPDLEVEESYSELGQTEGISRVRGRGIGSRGGMPQVVDADGAAAEPARELGYSGMFLVGKSSQRHPPASQTKC